MNQITDNLYIGDYTDGEHQPDDCEITATVSLTKRETQNTTHHRPLKDGVNDHSDFCSAVETTISLLESGETVLVHCAVGVSRSATVCTIAISEHQNVNLEDAYRKVEQERGFVAPTEPLQLHARAYKENNPELVPDENWQDMERYAFHLFA